MQKFLISLIFCLFLWPKAHADADKKEILDGVALETAKEGATRSYQGTIQRNLSFPIEMIKASVTNFSDRCNNDHRKMRKFTAQGLNCKHHNEHFVETFIIKDIKQQESFKHFTETYLLGRRAYNRGLIGYHELVQIKEEKINQKIKSVIITLKMLGDEEINQFINPKFKNDSAFDESLSTFTINFISESETHLKYTYKASTDHWLLNKEISTQQVFVSISKSLNTLFKSIQDEAIYLKSLQAKKE